MAERRYKFFVAQGGVIVASGETPTLKQAKAEGMHYAQQYALDREMGAVTLEVTTIKPRKAKKNPNVKEADRG